MNFFRQGASRISVSRRLLRKSRQEATKLDRRWNRGSVRGTQPEQHGEACFLLHGVGGEEEPNWDVFRPRAARG